jgi:hypothetical protein
MLASIVNPAPAAPPGWIWRFLPGRQHDCRGTSEIPGLGAKALPEDGAGRHRKAYRPRVSRTTSRYRTALARPSPVRLFFGRLGLGRISGLPTRHSAGAPTFPRGAFLRGRYDENEKYDDCHRRQTKESIFARGQVAFGHGSPPVGPCAAMIQQMGVAKIPHHAKKSRREPGQKSLTVTGQQVRPLNLGARMGGGMAPKIAGASAC